MPSKIYRDFLDRVDRLVEENQSGQSQWNKEAYSAISLMLTELVPIIRVSVSMLDTDTFLHALLTYQQLVQDAVSALLQNANRLHQDELVTETEIFVIEIIRDMVHQLEASKLEREVINKLLEAMWNELHPIRPPPK